MTSMQRELRRGTTELAILAILSQEEMYGYNLITTIKEKTKEQLFLKEGTLYPILYRLEDGGLVESCWQVADRGVPRRYYFITAKGKAELKKMKDAWLSFTRGFNSLLEEVLS